jgi:MFS transporter, ACS family, D-galactonate transporter
MREAIQGRATEVRWRVLWLMVIGSLVAYVLRLNVSIAGEAMIRDLLLTPVQFGLILSAFAWGYGLFQVPGGLFGEWLGPRRALTLAITAWGLVTLGTAWKPGADRRLAARWLHAGNEHPERRDEWSHGVNE